MSFDITKIRAMYEFGKEAKVYGRIDQDDDYIDLCALSRKLDDINVENMAQTVMYARTLGVEDVADDIKVKITKILHN